MMQETRGPVCTRRAEHATRGPNFSTTKPTKSPIARPPTMASEPSWYHGIESFTGIDLDGDGIIGAPGKAAAPSSEELLPEELLPEDDFEAELQPGSEEKPARRRRKSRRPAHRGRGG